MIRSSGYRSARSRCPAVPESSSCACGGTPPRFPRGWWRRGTPAGSRRLDGARGGVRSGRPLSLRAWSSFLIELKRKAVILTATGLGVVSTYNCCKSGRGRAALTPRVEADFKNRSTRGCILGIGLFLDDIFGLPYCPLRDTARLAGAGRAAGGDRERRARHPGGGAFTRRPPPRGRDPGKRLFQRLHRARGRGSEALAASPASLLAGTDP